MKMVAAVKLRRAQAAVVAARPYARRMKEVLQHLCAAVDVSANPLVAPRESTGIALVVVTSDRGLCGAFNSNLLKAVLDHVETRYPTAHAEGRLKFFCIGKRGFDFLSRRHFKIAGKYIGVYSTLVFGQAQAIVREILEGYMRGEYGLVELMYNEFKSIAQQRIMVDRFLPIPQESAGAGKGGDASERLVDYIYEPSARGIIDAVIPKHLNFQLWRVLLESIASEQGARMAAMENATENASELISSLQLSYNKARQAAITKELLEVVGGAEALRKGG
jgi:F-type H+-transporting ATPase subunit gamma